MGKGEIDAYNIFFFFLSLLPQCLVTIAQRKDYVISMTSAVILLFFFKGPLLPPKNRHAV